MIFLYACFALQIIKTISKDFWNRITTNFSYEPNCSNWRVTLDRIVEILSPYVSAGLLMLVPTFKKMNKKWKSWILPSLNSIFRGWLDRMGNRFQIRSMKKLSLVYRGAYITNDLFRCIYKSFFFLVILSPLHVSKILVFIKRFFKACFSNLFLLIWMRFLCWTASALCNRTL